MVDDSGGDSFGVEEGGGTACIEDGGKVEVVVAIGEILEEGNSANETKCGLRDVLVLSLKFGVKLDVADDLELGDQM